MWKRPVIARKRTRAVGLVDTRSAKPVGVLVDTRFRLTVPAFSSFLRVTSDYAEAGAKLV
jgi:hypothetical protein